VNDSHFSPATIYPSLSYDDAAAAIDWLCHAFGFEKRLVVPGPDGGVLHSELSFGPGVIMISSARPELGRLSPRGLAGVNQALALYVDDPDAHCAQAVAAGAEVMQPLRDEEYGARGYGVKDIEGHSWYFGDYRPGAYWDGAGAAEPDD